MAHRVFCRADLRAAFRGAAVGMLSMVLWSAAHGGLARPGAAAGLAAGSRHPGAIDPEAAVTDEPFRCVLRRDPVGESQSNASVGVQVLLPPGNICFDGELADVQRLSGVSSGAPLQVDGWGRPLRVRCGEAALYVYSAGADGKSNTDDDVGFRSRWFRDDLRRTRAIEVDEPEGMVHGPGGVHAGALPREYR